MKINPKLLYRIEQNYIAIAKKVLRKDIPKALPPLIPKLKSWLKSKNIEPAGPPFFLLSANGRSTTGGGSWYTN